MTFILTFECFNKEPLKTGKYPAIFLLCVQPAMDIEKLEAYGYSSSANYLMGKR